MQRTAINCGIGRLKAVASFFPEQGAHYLRQKRRGKNKEAKKEKRGEKREEIIFSSNVRFNNISFQTF